MDQSLIRFVGFEDRVLCLLKVSIVVKWSGAGKTACMEEDRRPRNLDNYLTVVIGVSKRS